MATSSNRASVFIPRLISAAEAARLLDVRIPTLYAYVSRGQLQSLAAAGRGKRSVYDREEVLRLKARHNARAGHGPAAAAALAWGSAVLDSQITEVTSAGPRYRGHNTCDLVASGRNFEDVAELLMVGDLPCESVRYAANGPPLSGNLGKGTRGPLLRLMAMLAMLAQDDSERVPLARMAEVARARSIIAQSPFVMAPETWLRMQKRRKQCSEPLAHRLCEVLELEPTAGRRRLIDAMLIACADHELNVSTFAARIVASAGADLYACLIAAAGALSGPHHGGATARVEAMVEEIRASRRTAKSVIAARVRRGEMLPGLGHPLYPDGDPRGRLLLELAQEHAPRDATVKVVVGVARAAEEQLGAHATLDMGLVAASAAVGVPSGLACGFFAIGRLAGWVAHVLEQRAQGSLLRPRARYVGPPGVERPTRM